MFHLAPHPLFETGLVLSQLVPVTERALIKLAYVNFHIAADAVRLLWVNQFMVSLYLGVLWVQGGCWGGSLEGRGAALAPDETLVFQG